MSGNVGPGFLTLRLGELPPGPNDSGGGRNRKRGLLNSHWAQYSKLKHRWRMLVRSAVPAGFEGFGAGPVEMWVARFSKGVMDRDNAWASLKPVLDGLIHAGVIADDSEQVLPWPKLVQVRTTDAAHVGLVIHLYAMEDSAQAELQRMRRWAEHMPRPLEGQYVGQAGDGTPAVGRKRRTA